MFSYIYKYINTLKYFLNFYLFKDDFVGITGEKTVKEKNIKTTFYKFEYATEPKIIWKSSKDANNYPEYMNRYLTEKNYPFTLKDDECPVKKNWPSYNKKKTRGMFYSVLKQ